MMNQNTKITACAMAPDALIAAVGSPGTSFESSRLPSQIAKTRLPMGAVMMGRKWSLKFGRLEMQTALLLHRRGNIAAIEAKLSVALMHRCGIARPADRKLQGIATALKCLPLPGLSVILGGSLGLTSVWYL